MNDPEKGRKTMYGNVDGKWIVIETSEMVESDNNLFTQE